MVSALEDREADEVLALAGEHLPEPLMDLSREEQKAYLEKKTLERKDIQKQLAKLQIQRKTYLSDHHRKATLDATMSRAIRGQMEKIGFVFEK